MRTTPLNRTPFARPPPPPYAAAAAASLSTRSPLHVAPPRVSLQHRRFDTKKKRDSSGHQRSLQRQNLRRPRRSTDIRTQRRRRLQHRRPSELFAMQKRRASTIMRSAAATTAILSSTRRSASKSRRPLRASFGFVCATKCQQNFYLCARFQINYGCV